MSCLHISYKESAVVTIVVSSLGDKEKEEAECIEVECILDTAASMTTVPKEEKAECILDTGASMTAVPEEVITKLKIPSTGVVSVKAWDGTKTLQLSYLLKVFLCDRKFKVKVLTTKDSQGLIGMDILNKWLFELNGPGREFSLIKI